MVKAAGRFCGIPSSFQLHAPIPLDDGADEVSLGLAHEGGGGDGLGQRGTGVQGCVPRHFEGQAVVNACRQLLLVRRRVSIPSERQRGGGRGDAPLLVLGLTVLLVLRSVQCL